MKKGRAMKGFYAVAVAGAVLGLGLLTAPVVGHHSTNAMYDESRTIEVSGSVLEWRFVNPHPYLVVEVKTDGKAEKWDFSFGGSAVSHLRRQGYTPQSFKIGEAIVARGYPATSETSRGLLVRGGIKRQDGTAIP
jgi:hypothetical protein